MSRQRTSDTAVQATIDAYSLGDALPAGPEQIAPGTNLLLTGPGMVGKRDLALDLVAADSQDRYNAVLVPTDRSATQLLEAYDARTKEGNVYAVDCSGQGAEATDRVVETVSSPSDLTGIGMGIVKATRAIGEGATSGVCVATITVSTLLQYTGQERVFHFLHTLTRRLSQAGYLGVFTLNPNTHDQRTVSSIQALFDSRVEIRETDGTRELRVRGLTNASGEWAAWPRN